MKVENRYSNREGQEENPNSNDFLDPDPYSMYPDPHPWLKVFYFWYPFEKKNAQLLS